MALDGFRNGPIPVIIPIGLRDAPVLALRRGRPRVLQAAGVADHVEPVIAGSPPPPASTARAGTQRPAAITMENRRDINLFIIGKRSFQSYKHIRNPLNPLLYRAATMAGHDAAITPPGHGDRRHRPSSWRRTRRRQRPRRRSGPRPPPCTPPCRRRRSWGARDRQIHDRHHKQSAYGKNTRYNRKILTIAGIFDMLRT